MMDRVETEALVRQILARQGKPTTFTDDSTLREIGFRSLDFSELVLRVEMATGVEMDLDAGPMRRIATVGDVLEFVEATYGAGARATQPRAR